MADEGPSTWTMTMLDKILHDIATEDLAALRGTMLADETETRQRYYQQALSNVLGSAQAAIGIINPPMWHLVLAGGTVVEEAPSC